MKINKHESGKKNIRKKNIIEKTKKRKKNFITDNTLDGEFPPLVSERPIPVKKGMSIYPTGLRKRENRRKQQRKREREGREQGKRHNIDMEDSCQLLIPKII